MISYREYTGVVSLRQDVVVLLEGGILASLEFPDLKATNLSKKNLK